MSQPPEQQHGADAGPGGGWGPPSGPPSGSPVQGDYPPPSQYGTPGQYGAPAGYGQPGPYGTPAGYGQPGQYGPYGVPTAWGYPAQPPRRRSRLPRILRRVVLAVLVIGAGMTLPALLGPTRLDPHAVQRDVAGQFQRREGVALDLRCTEKMTVEAGRTYACAGTTADNQQLTITITITDRDGAYTWSQR